MKYLIILSIVFVAILITALIVYSTKPVGPYEELGVWDSLKKLFSKLKREEVTREELTENFIQKYLKEEFWPSEVNLVLSKSRIAGRSYYMSGWRKGDDFQVKVEYNNDGTLSHLTLYVLKIARDTSANHFFILPDMELDCFEMNQRKYCKSSWVDGKNRMDLLVGLTANDNIHYLLLCKMYEESEVYDKICGIV